MLLAASESAVTKKPRLRLMMRRSSSVRPFGSFHVRDVARHVHFLRHPVVGAGGEVLLPGPLVLERHQLVDVGLAVDDALVGGVDTALDGGGAWRDSGLAGRIHSRLHGRGQCLHAQLRRGLEGRRLPHWRRGRRNAAGDHGLQAGHRHALPRDRLTLNRGIAAGFGLR
jgi:hypothetical protein